MKLLIFSVSLCFPFLALSAQLECNQTSKTTNYPSTLHLNPNVQPPTLKGPPDENGPNQLLTIRTMKKESPFELEGVVNFSTNCPRNCDNFKLVIQPDKTAELFLGPEGKTSSVAKYNCGTVSLEDLNLHQQAQKKKKTTGPQ